MGDHPGGLLGGHASDGGTVSERLGALLERRDLSGSLRGELESLVKDAARLESGEEIERLRDLAALGVSVLSVHHEIATPIARISERLDLLLERWDAWDMDRKRDWTAKCLHDAEIIGALNRYVGSSGRRLGSTRERVDIGAAIGRVRDGFAGLLGQHGIQLEVEAGEAPPVYMRPASLDSVITNLVANSARALLVADRSRVVVVSYGAEGGDLVVRVRDNGLGIRREELGGIFGAFRTSGGGTGLGLAIVREIVRGHGGDITVKSTSEEEEPGGGGTEFTVKLPLEGLREE
ncbi:putative Histidine kinase [Nitrosopumilaceae archaeon]|nr:HAMP domain-containing histidine kinase [Nitrosopumilus sp.]MDA7997490.1 HAMP domain-containing histidine kinase [Nitrosopumilus sp.]CAI9832591.1 putative Histidine kinase [Nitrosopumilaceae archaeon]